MKTRGNQFCEAVLLGVNPLMNGKATYGLNPTANLVSVRKEKATPFIWCCLFLYTQLWKLTLFKEGVSYVLEASRYRETVKI